MINSYFMIHIISVIFIICNIYSLKKIFYHKQQKTKFYSRQEKSIKQLDFLINLTYIFKKIIIIQEQLLVTVAQSDQQKRENEKRKRLGTGPNNLVHENQNQKHHHHHKHKKKKKQKHQKHAHKHIRMKKYYMYKKTIL